METSEGSSALARQLEAEIAALRASAAAERLNQEQLVHQIESQFRDKEAEATALQLKLQAATEDGLKHVRQIASLQADNEELRQTVRALRESVQDLESVERDRAKILKLNESLQSDVDRLSKESSEFHKKMLEMNSERAAMQSQYFSTQTKVSALEFELRESVQEKSRLEKRVAWLAQELESKDLELQEQHKARSTQLQDLEGKWHAAKEEARGLHATITDLRSRLDSAEQRAAAFSEEARQLRSEKALQLESSRQELAAQTRLAQLHQKGAEDERALVAQLQRTIELAHEKLSAEEVKSAEASSALSVALAEAKELRARLGQAEAELAESRAEVDRLAHTSTGGDTLGPSDEHLRELCSLSEADMQRLGPAERYARFVDMATALRALQSANRNLQSYLTQIQRELEYNQPLVEQQRTEYQGLLASHQRVSQRLEIANRQLEAARAEHASAAAENKDLRARVSALEKESNAAARQVHHLLKQLPGAHGIIPSGLAPAVPRSPWSLDRLVEAEGRMASELVADHLTVYSSVEELAEQHQKLRGALLAIIHRVDEAKAPKERLPFRARSGKDEADDDDNNDEPMSSRDHQAAKQIQELREAREKQEQRVALLSQQLELLRRAMKDSPAIAQAAGVPHDAAREKSAETLLADLRAEFERYRGDKTKYESQLKDELNQSQRACSELRMKVASFESEVSILKDTAARTAASNTQLQREAETLRQQLAHFSSITLKLQDASQHTSSELAIARDQVRRCSEQLTAAAVDREQALASERSSQQQLAELKEDKARMTACIERLQRLQATLEETHAEALNRERAQREELQREWQSSREALEKERTAQRDLMTAHHATTGELHRKVEAAERELQAARSELSLAQGTVRSQAARIEELSAAHDRAQAQLDALLTKRVSSQTDLSEGKFGAGTREQRGDTELAAAQRECSELSQQLTEAQNHLADFKRLATQQEYDLKSMQEAAEVYREKMERSLAASEAARADLQKRLDELSERSRSSDTESSRVISQLEARVLSLEAEQRALREGRNELEQQLREARDRALSAVEAARVEAARAEQFQDHYRRELSMHGKTAEALAAAQTQLQEHARTAAAANSQIATEHQELKSRLRALEAEKAETEQTLTQAQARLTETVQQNTLLMAQIDTLGGQLRTMSVSGRSGIADPAAEVAKALELVKHIRHEKELLEAQLEVAKQETSKTAQRLAHTERSLEQTRTQLELEISRRPESEARPSAATEPAVLRESNELLRQECERYSKRVGELERQMAQAQQALEPLTRQIRQLSNEKDALEADRQSAREEAQRWRERSQQLLDKYQQVDPEAHHRVVLKCEQLEAEKAHLEERCGRVPGLEARLAQLSGELEEAKIKLQSATQANTRLRTAQTKSTATAAEHKRLTDELGAATVELAAARAEIDQLRKAADCKVQLSDAQAEGLRAGQQQAERRTGRAIQLVRVSGDAIREQREKLQSLQAQLEQSQRTVSEQQLQVTALQTELSSVRQQLEESVRRHAELNQQSGQQHAQVLAELQLRAQRSEEAAKQAESRHLEELKVERDRADQVQASLAALQAELKRAQLQLSAAQDESSARESELARLQEEIARLKEERPAEQPAPVSAPENDASTGTEELPPLKRTRMTPSPKPAPTVVEPRPAVFAQGAFVPLRPPTPTGASDPEQLPRFGSNVVLTAPSATTRPTSPIVSAAEFWPTPSAPVASLAPVPEELFPEAEADAPAADEPDSAPRALKRKRGSEDPAIPQVAQCSQGEEPVIEAENEAEPTAETHLEPATPHTPPDTAEATQEQEDLTEQAEPAESADQPADAPSEAPEAETPQAEQEQEYADEPESGHLQAPEDVEGPADMDADASADVEADQPAAEDEDAEDQANEHLPSAEHQVIESPGPEPVPAPEHPAVDAPITPSGETQATDQPEPIVLDDEDPTQSDPHATEEEEPENPE